MATVLVNCRTAPLLAPYAERSGVPRKAASDDRFTIEPPPDWRIAGTPCLQPRNTPWTLIARMRCHCSTVSLSNVEGNGPAMPALLTKPFSRPSRARISSMIRFQSDRENALPLLDRLALECRGKRPGDAGVVDQAIQPALARQDIVDDPLPIRSGECAATARPSRSRMSRETARRCRRC